MDCYPVCLDNSSITRLKILPVCFLFHSRLGFVVGVIVVRDLGKDP